MYKDDLYRFSQVYSDKCAISNNKFQLLNAFIKLYFISLQSGLS